MMANPALAATSPIAPASDLATARPLPPLAIAQPHLATPIASDASNPLPADRALAVLQPVPDPTHCAVG